MLYFILLAFETSLNIFFDIVLDYLATSKSSWWVPSSVVIPDVLHPPVHGFLSVFFSWFFGYLAHKFIHPHRRFHSLPMIVHLPSPVLCALLVLLFHFIVFLPIKWFFLPLGFFISSLSPLLSIFLSILHPWAFVHLCCLLWCQCDLFLIEHWLLCLSF